MTTNLNKGDQKHGFTLVDSQFIQDANAQVHTFAHEQSGGQVIWVENDDQNRSFGIGFKTPPKDSTGVAHIVEHSVLSGSRKYPAKDPFMTMLKTSMNTFLNAMTFSDMTIYPVSSMNEEDFHNLTDVYLDAVFFPKMTSEENIFRQEGWHKELFDKDEPIIYNGVVYNEMRGAYSDAERIIMQDVTANMHPGSTYAHESGGYPYEIPDLTFDNFKQFHADHYRPDNALAYVYGDIDIDRTLGQINGDFFSEFLKKDQQVQFDLPETKDGHIEYQAFYDADERKTAEDDSYLTYMTHVGASTDLTNNYVANILSDALIESEAAPIRQALIEAGLAEEVEAIGSDGYYLDFGLVLKQFNPANKDKALAVIKETLTDLVANGINRDLLEGVINTREFAARQAGGAMKGITYEIQMTMAWRYGMSPTEVLHFSKYFDDLRAKLATDFYEEWLQDNLLAADASLVGIYQPRVGLFKEQDDQLEAKLAAEKAAMTDQDIQALIEENQALRVYQDTPDTEEARQALPKLDISDVPRTTQAIAEETLTGQQGVPVLFHEQDASGIRYVQLAYRLDHITAEDLPYVNYLTILLGLLDTENYDYRQMDIEMMKATAGISMRPKVFIREGSQDDYVPVLVSSFAAIGDHSARGFELLQDTMKFTDFSDKARILNVLQRVKFNMSQSYEGAGHRVAISRLRSFYSQAAKYEDVISGLSFYDHMTDLIENFSTKADDFIAKLIEVNGKMWDPRMLTVSLTADAADKATLLEQVDHFIDQADQTDNVEPVSVEFDLAGNNYHEAIQTNGNVQYVSVGGRVPIEDYNGRYVVFANILSKDYLHENIRAKGGAYGAGISLTSSGDVTTYSYRDPNVDKTVDVYRKLPDFLANPGLSQDDLDQLIIGSMTAFHYPLTPASVNNLMVTRHFRGMTKDMLDARLSQALDTKVADLVAFKDQIQIALDADNLVVFGNKQKIDDSTQTFNNKRTI
ncbi:presequence protease [Aerococcus sp. 150760007-1]|uniref:Insulinase family protein n=1 Tax=Aerococcus urinaeequi TaxID=51665 RepID=A0ABR5ZZC6_9LACT|nr:insulinase family protein [Aerococcus urinaeequi]MBA5747082.1 insulinase family protein [Aerococcus urinaeequi]MBA5829866.1 insulinase family protein [Aerococcus urinaeequi]MBA5860474.1 insulinase family protein [Aerococcus urinaeequi]